MSKNWKGMDATKIKYLTGNEWKSFLKEVKGYPRDDAIFNLAFAFGLRVSEIQRLKLSDINLEEVQIRIIRSKSGKNRVYNLNPILVKKLRRWLRQREKFTPSRNHYLFVTERSAPDLMPISIDGLKYLFRNYAKKAQIPDNKAHIHALRHTTGVMLAKKGRDVLYIRNWLGHTSVLTTQCYLELGSEDLKKDDEATLELLSQNL